MNFAQEMPPQEKSAGHVQRIVLAISTAVCMFAFQNCSFVDKAAMKAAPVNASASQELKVDQAHPAR